MGEQREKLRRAYLLLLLVLLALGGGSFLVMIVVSTDNLKARQLHYDFSSRSPLVDFFRRMGFIPDEDTAVRKITDRILEATARDIVENAVPRELFQETRRDDNGLARPKPDNFPRLNGGNKGGTYPGGGASMTSKAAAGFSGAGGGKPRVSGPTGEEEQPQRGKGAMRELGGARQALGGALRTASASEARAKWDQGFFGTTGGAAPRQKMDYAGSIVPLDKIKSGEIESLKPKAAPEASGPKRDKEGEKKDENLNKLKAAGDKSKDASSVLKGLGGDGAAGGGKKDETTVGGGPVPPPGPFPPWDPPPDDGEPQKDPENPDDLSPERIDEMVEEMKSGLKSIESGYGALTDMKYTDCGDSPLCGEHNVTGGFLTVTTETGATALLAYKYIDGKYQRYTMDFTPGESVQQ